jgi:hypothetical protein
MRLSSSPSMGTWRRSFSYCLVVDAQRLFSRAKIVIGDIDVEGGGEFVNKITQGGG